LLQLDLQLVSEIHWPSAGLLKSVGSKSAALPWWSIPGFLPFCDKALASAQTILAYLSHELIPQGCLIPTCIDHDPRAHWRRPMVMMRHG
jgi:hypothetical protein